MHRTLITLEDAQYEFLRARARREGKSLAAVIREILDEHLRVGTDPRDRGSDRFYAVIGIGSGDGSGMAEKYEDYLYGSESWS